MTTLDSLQFAKDSLKEAIARLHKERETADFTLVCGEETFRVHSFILKARSAFFRTALEAPMVEKRKWSMDIQECSPQVLSEVIDFMYGIGTNSYFPEPIGLLEVAERFLMDDLKADALRRVTKMIRMENYLEICQLTEKFDSEMLIEKCSQFLLTYTQYCPTNVDWEEIHKLPKLSIAVMKLSKDLVEVQCKKNILGSIKLLEIADSLNMTELKKEATVYLSTQMSRFQRDSAIT